VERLSEHAELQELLGAYALDAVEPEEAAAIERHLPTCPRCRNELTDHREVAALLGYAGASAPSGVWDRIVASLEEPPPALQLARFVSSASPQPRPTEVEQESIAEGWGPKTPPPVHARRSPDGGAPVVPIGQGRKRKSVPMRFMVAMATVAALIVAALGVEVGRLQVHKSPATDNIALLAYRAAEANPANRHLTLVSSDGSRTLPAIIASDGMTYLGPGNLDTLPTDETYQMWGIVDGARVSLGVIGDKPTYAAFTTPNVASVLAMTVESRGGVVTSTKTPVVTGVVPNA
jgi:anti-sigma factor RsiW